MILTELSQNTPAKITNCLMESSDQEETCFRLNTLGFVEGTRVEVIKAATLTTPLIVKVENSQVAMRKSESDLIEVSLCH